MVHLPKKEYIILYRKKFSFQLLFIPKTAT